MRPYLGFLALLVSVACTGGNSSAPAVPGWPELPHGTRAVLLVTGADSGFWKPQGCNQGAGGAQYRIALDRWLGARYPEIARVWLSTGNTVDAADDSIENPESMLRKLRDIPYRAIAVGEGELKQLSLERLVLMQRDERVPLLSTHLYDRDAMAPLFPAETTLELAGGKWVVLALGPDRRDWQQALAGHGAIVTVDPVSAIAARVASAKAASQHVVLLSNLPQAEVDRLTQKIAGIDLICATDGATSFDTVHSMNNTPSLWLGISGLHLGRVAIGDGGRVLEIQTLIVRKPFPVDPAVDGTLPAR